MLGGGATANLCRNAENQGGKVAENEELMCRGARHGIVVSNGSSVLESLLVASKLAISPLGQQECYRSVTSEVKNGILSSLPPLAQLKTSWEEEEAPTSIQ
ncbi:hypothetical protein RRG08_047467 [Elysia crispata]|uniref:Uncharacterized protein n=1 Tax=Elysia crispata TaxID=231223 RepID=A0AAE0YK06_9GAST|nr:hypothetical protein RRG08_047467 [Elysia crispata]